MIDHAPQVAAFLVERHDPVERPEGLWAEMCRRWPGLTVEEGERGAQIASEILAGTIAENAATYEVLEATPIDQLTAIAVANWGEAEFQEVAAVAAIPLDAVR